MTPIDEEPAAAGRADATNNGASADLAALDPSKQDLKPRRRDAVLEFLLTRRSTPAKTLDGPGPSEDEIALMLRVAARAPDHGKLTPWRFLRIEGADQTRLAKRAAAHLEATGAGPEAAAKALRSFSDGALILGVVSSPIAHPKIPELEQILSAGAVCGQLLAAALALGYGANWLTSAPTHDPRFQRAALGLRPHERIAGFIHIGRPRTTPSERPRPNVADLIGRPPE